MFTCSMSPGPSGCRNAEITRADSCSQLTTTSSQRLAQGTEQPSEGPPYLPQPTRLRGLGKSAARYVGGADRKASALRMGSVAGNHVRSMPRSYTAVSTEGQVGL